MEQRWLESRAGGTSRSSARMPSYPSVAPRRCPVSTVGRTRQFRYPPFKHSRAEKASPEPTFEKIRATPAARPSWNERRPRRRRSGLCPVGWHAGGLRLVCCHFSLQTRELERRYPGAVYFTSIVFHQTSWPWRTPYPTRLPSATKTGSTRMSPTSNVLWSMTTTHFPPDLAR